MTASIHVGASLGTRRRQTRDVVCFQVLLPIIDIGGRPALTSHAGSVTVALWIGAAFKTPVEHRDAVHAGEGVC